ncbi:MAG: hypothetical protein UT53_C0004G0013 [Candidatus Yanofskybacteria bacterium GW2011_GWD2_39_48]|uniref:Uncharacterized protein n=1 Tax=Candidatus Yanofskybacteria bacterium GW2011_GWD2_39_48 TaxID=1619031 RepID=A0A0G0RMZ8_9BACT|nr:MAG: hypothetical protein UT53_C0004G0013 [Candidatus Yanofskybacteria bacterium GW2011_GWD2_39_48]
MKLDYSVDIYQLGSDYKQTRIATFKFHEDDHKVEVDSQDHPAVFLCIREGIFDQKYARPGKVFPDDGLAFLENLKYHFRSGYITATEVREERVDNYERIE